MGKQFSKVSCVYGAPMGRSENHRMPDKPRSIRLFAVNLDSGGYDDGGAYWGLSTRGQRLYCAVCEDEGHEYREFVRARSRSDAAIKLDIPMRLLKVPCGGVK